MFTEIMLGAEALLTGASLFEKQQSAGIQDTALQLKETRSQMNALQQVQREQMRQVKTMSAQAADEAVTGFDAASPSYKNLSMRSFDAFINDEHATALNEQFKESSIKSQRMANRRNKNASMFGTLSRFGMDVLNTTRLSSLEGKGADSKAVKGK